MTTTTHNGALFGTERGILEHLAHYVDGVPLVGGRGTPLQTLLDESYRREADALLGDLDAIAAAMHDRDRASLRGKLSAMASVLEQPEAPSPDVSVPGDRTLPDDRTATFTADYGNGGRPITGDTPVVPDPPVLDDDVKGDEGESS